MRISTYSPEVMYSTVFTYICVDYTGVRLFFPEFTSTHGVFFNAPELLTCDALCSLILLPLGLPVIFFSTCVTLTSSIHVHCFHLFILYLSMFPCTCVHPHLCSPAPVFTHTCVHPHLCSPAPVFTHTCVHLHLYTLSC